MRRIAPGRDAGGSSHATCWKISSGRCPPGRLGTQAGPRLPHRLPATNAPCITATLARGPAGLTTI